MPLTEQAFHSATLVAKRPAGTGLVWLALKAPMALALAHQRAGQYLQMRTDATSKAAYMALANAPGEPWGILVKEEGAGVAFCALSEGSSIELTSPMGPGFPLSALPQGGDLLLVGVGTGLAPLRSALREVLTQRAQFGRLVWLAGAKNPESMPFVDEWAEWRAAGVEVLPCYSDATVPHAHRGQVQERLGTATDGQAASFSAFVCGMPAMEASVREALLSLGLAANAFYLNH